MGRPWVFVTGHYRVLDGKRTWIDGYYREPRKGEMAGTTVPPRAETPRNIQKWRYETDLNPPLGRDEFDEPRRPYVDPIEAEYGPIDDSWKHGPKVARLSAKVQLASREFSTESREKMAKSGSAMPGGGFPIPDVDALKRAIQSIGRAKDPAAAKAHIKKRARALGREDLIPEDW